jgi:hypothetical protein
LKIEVNRVSVNISVEQSKGPYCFVEIQNTERLWANISGFRHSGFREYKSQTSTHRISRICDKMSSTLSFGVWFFVSTKSQSSIDCNSRKVISTSGIRRSGFRECKCPNNHTYKPLKCRKREGGSRTSGFRGFKYQTTIHHNSRIPKGERMWDDHFRISGFGISGFQIPNHNTHQLPNTER